MVFQIMFSSSSSAEGSNPLTSLRASSSAATASSPQDVSGHASVLSSRQEELHKCMIGTGRTVGSMNIEEFIRNVWDTDVTTSAVLNPPNLGTSAMLNLATLSGMPQQPNLQSQSNLSLLKTVSGKSMEDLWKQAQPKSEEIQEEHHQECVKPAPPSPFRQTTQGEMTLEDFLVRTGVVKEDVKTDAKGNLPFYPTPGVLSPAMDQGDWMNLAQRQPHQQLLQYAEAMARQGPNLFPCNQDEFSARLCPGGYMSNTPLSPAVSDYSIHSRKRGNDGSAIERSVERRQRRMIKNRESAARSRARRQAYTMELEAEVVQLKEENAKLRRLQALESCVLERARCSTHVLRRVQSWP